MLKVKITCGATWCGCSEETVEYEYDGTENKFYSDHIESTEILNMILNGEFPHYYMNIETEEIPDEDNEEDLNEEDEDYE